MSRIRQAKAALLEQLETIVRELAPGGSKAGSTYTAKNPARADRHAGSFVVWLKGVVAGGWKDYATGEQGDIIDLVCLAKATDRAGALAWAEDRLGLKAMAEDERRAMEARAIAARRAESERETHQRARKIDRQRKIFAGALDLPGSLAETYLAARGIELAALKFREERFRFLPAAEWWRGATQDENGRRLPGPRFPAMISEMVDGAGVPQAMHYTFLSPDGCAKAPVDKPKLMYPETSGLVIRVSRGRGNRNAETAAELGKPAPLFLCEGIEDAMSVALACPELRCWAAGSLPNLLSVPDHRCVNSWIVGQDNDWGKAQAQALFQRALTRFEATGKPVSVVASFSGKDFNDLLRG